jgi:hypothetical protein
VHSKGFPAWENSQSSRSRIHGIPPANLAGRAGPPPEKTGPRPQDEAWRRPHQSFRRKALLPVSVGVPGSRAADARIDHKMHDRDVVRIEFPCMVGRLGAVTPWGFYRKPRRFGLIVDNPNRQ